ncbi:voltage-dependent anion-selective channel protein 2-like [Sinocyclocheilus rhinocerous]|uniref:voltage-dependent anion-selective channel protein 2-like n=1 Tax=Sinocyclocheilus rhinocerous TaxID=307959 RepID=UPI0007B9FD7E|nr:PREDICTED: voltage-dependent anion-selective channel protein 2-like [Sinocyclocheilus rhinocerous]XP_016418679.1 PREDICTED: voltage-dependent anion-selective channel protein 2-like [Sinocyclocheilus rhinocerous]
MAVPPAYADLGKAAKDVFNKGYGFGTVKLDVKTKSANGVEFKTCGTSNMDSNKVSGNLETKYKWAEYRLTFTEKWSTDNTLGTEISVEDQVQKNNFLMIPTVMENLDPPDHQLWRAHYVLAISRRPHMSQC